MLCSPNFCVNPDASFMQALGQKYALHSKEHLQSQTEYLRILLLLQPKFHALSQEGLIRLTVGDATETERPAASGRVRVRPDSRRTIGVALVKHFSRDRRPNGYLGLSKHYRTIIFLAILLDKTVSVG